MDQRMDPGASKRRLGATVFVALGAVLAFAAVGGTGLAGSLVKPVKAQYGQYGPGQYNAKKSRSATRPR